MGDPSRCGDCGEELCDCGDDNIEAPFPSREPWICHRCFGCTARCDMGSDIDHDGALIHYPEE